MLAGGAREEHAHAEGRVCALRRFRYYLTSMLERLWDRLVTFVRPDRAALQPTLDFDPETGQLGVGLEVRVGNRRAPVVPETILRGRGTLGNRSFRIPPGDVHAFQRVARFLHRKSPHTMACGGPDVPTCLEEFRASLAPRESSRVSSIRVCDAAVAAEISAEEPNALHVAFTGRTEVGKTFPITPGDLREGKFYRDGSTYYRVLAWPQGSLGSIDQTGCFPHHVDAETVRRFAEVDLETLRQRATVGLSPQAEALLQSARRPIPTQLAPRVDFAPATGQLTVTLEEISPAGRHRLEALGSLEKPRLVGHQFHQLDGPGQSLAQSLRGLAGASSGDTVQIGGSAVPKAIELLRAHTHTEMTPAAATVRLHPNPLEQRTYVELEDPDTLLIKQNLVAEDDRRIVPPDLSTPRWPEWVRVGPDYFRPPAAPPKAPTRSRRVAPGTYRSSADEVPEFIEKDLPDLRKAGRVFLDKEASQLRVVTSPPSVGTTIDLDQKKHQVVVRPTYRSGSTTLPHAEVDAADHRKSFLRRGRTFHRIDWPLVERVNSAVRATRLTAQADGSYVGSQLHFDEIINVFSRLGILSETEVFRRFRTRLLDFSQIARVPLPSALLPDSAVREYQRAGYDWLAFLKEYGLPGILADEMGLGKTLQVLLGVAHFRDRFGFCPSLVVCPAALVEKWMDEKQKFFTGLRGLTYAGPKRQEMLLWNMGTADLVITSYETLVRDADRLANHKWRFLIADEAQRIKNPETRRAHAIRKIPAEARIAITGTPVENSLRDLWAVFDFLAPGYLGTATEFQRTYGDPIERGRSREAADRLRRRVGPFLLRRLKRQVAKELPEKLPKPLRCELTPVQRELYRAVIKRDLEAAIAAVGGKKLSLGNPHIFAVLTKLKQICCHPGLITQDFQPYKTGVSGKFDAFVEVLDEILEAEPVDGGRSNKLVTFSQYVPMVHYLHDCVGARGKKCGLIDGRVPPGDRHALCRTFNSDPALFGMMLTLGSGGVGLDLPGANYVVLYDRWWNPAVEDQAIDRVHRIGQEREVVVVTITTRGTLEERIEAKLERKRDLSEQVIQADALMKKEITREELIELVRLEE